MGRGDILARYRGLLVITVSIWPLAWCTLNCTDTYTAIDTPCEKMTVGLSARVGTLAFLVYLIYLIGLTNGLSDV